MNWRAIIISTLLAAFIGVALLVLLPYDVLDSILKAVGFSCPRGYFGPGLRRFSAPAGAARG